MRLLVIIVLASCWREPARRTEPGLSFVARVNVLARLRRCVDELGPRLEAVMHAIRGLSSEAERDAIHHDLDALDEDVVRLSQIANASRARGDDPNVLDAIDCGLERAALGLANLHDELLHARTIADERALEEIQAATQPELRSRSYLWHDTIHLPVEPQELETSAPRP